MLLPLIRRAVNDVDAAAVGLPSGHVCGELLICIGDAAYDSLASQPGVDKTRVAVGGGSCGVNNAMKLAEQHPDFKALVLLAGGTDLAGINYIAQHPERPIFTAAAADDEYNPATLELMQWFSDLSGNPRTKFSGFKDGRHGTEIFGPHPELVHQVVAFLVDTLVTS